MEEPWSRVRQTEDETHFTECRTGKAKSNHVHTRQKVLTRARCAPGAIHVRGGDFTQSSSVLTISNSKAKNAGGVGNLRPFPSLVTSH